MADSLSNDEVGQLRARLAEVEHSLKVEREFNQRIHGVIREAKNSASGSVVIDDIVLTIEDLGQSETRQRIYEFEDCDAEAVEFDRFFTAPDPHLDRIRSFLLD